MIMMTLSTLVSQPVWLLVTLIGVADILILVWCITLIRRNRNQHYRAATRDGFVPLPEQPLPTGQFQQNLTCLQIDAVFDGLAALIETERVKLKTMIHPLAAPVKSESPSSYEAPEDKHDPTGDAFQAPMAEQPLDQQIARIADSGMKPAAIAGRLGISLAEVNLALRMRTGAISAAGCKLEAVA
jgi:hypothetical protein